MGERKLIKHTVKDNFHRFKMEVERWTYYLTVIKVPDKFISEGGWYGDSEGLQNGHYITILEEKNLSTGSWYAYPFEKSYFDGDSSYIAKRLGIDANEEKEFINCLKDFVFPVI